MAEGALLGRVRPICLAFPEVTGRLSHGAPTWFVRDTRAFAMLWAEGHHDTTSAHAWLAAAPGMQEALVDAAPDRFFRPPYVGGGGWIGVRLDGEPDWDELARLCREAYLAVAPARLAAGLANPITEP